MSPWPGEPFDGSVERERTILAAANVATLPCASIHPLRHSPDTGCWGVAPEPGCATSPRWFRWMETVVDGSAAGFEAMDLRVTIETPDVVASAPPGRQTIWLGTALRVIVERGSDCLIVAQVPHIPSARLARYAEARAQYRTMRYDLCWPTVPPPVYQGADWFLVVAGTGHAVMETLAVLSALALP